MGFFSYFHDLWQNSQIKKNFLIYGFIWSLFTVVYCVILVEMESVGGNLFLNMSVCSTIEVLAAVLAGTLTKKYNCPSILNKLLFFLSLFFSLFFLSPPSLTAGTPLQVLFFMGCMFLGKINNDLLNLVIYLYLPKAFTDKYVGFWLLCSRFSSRFFGLFVPYISYFMRNLGFHPFCFYGILWIFCRFLYTLTKEVQSEGVDDLLNEVNASLHDRLSVLVGSFSNGVLRHDDNLKNIHHEGVPLSVIRMLKQSQFNRNNASSIKGRDSEPRKKSSAGNKKLSWVEMNEKKSLNPL